MHDLLFTQIEADRIRLRRFQSADLAAFVAYRNDPEVARYQSWTSISDHEAQQFIEELKDAFPVRLEVVKSAQGSRVYVAG